MLFIAVDVAVERTKRTGPLGVGTEKAVFHHGVAFLERILPFDAGKFLPFLDDRLDPVVQDAFEESEQGKERRPVIAPGQERPFLGPLLLLHSSPFLKCTISFHNSS